MNEVKWKNGEPMDALWYAERYVILGGMAIVLVPLALVVVLG